MLGETQTSRGLHIRKWGQTAPEMGANGPRSIVHVHVYVHVHAHALPRVRRGGIPHATDRASGAREGPLPSQCSDMPGGLR